jgi:hypothetical protein
MNKQQPIWQMDIQRSAKFGVAMVVPGIHGYKMLLLNTNLSIFISVLKIVQDR